MTNHIHHVDITDGTINDLNLIYEQFTSDFPSDEQLSRDKIENLMNNGRYRLTLMKHRLTNSVIGYAFTYEPDALGIVWLDYMAVVRPCRNAGYGTLLFNEVSMHLRHNSIGVFIEVEPVSMTDSDLGLEQKRRITFYERLGAYKTDVDYQLPTKSGGVDMHLFFRPSSGVSHISKDQVIAVIASAFDYIHGDKEHRHELLQSFIQPTGDTTSR